MSDYLKGVYVEGEEKAETLLLSSSHSYSYAGLENPDYGFAWGDKDYGDSRKPYEGMRFYLPEEFLL